MNNIRNFVIIAHIDHGKSTLADRFLEITGAVDKRKMRAQYLDQMELERERGITIKMAPVRMVYKNYILNLIDTPGHSDFSYEVSRALAAVEGAILLVDALKGIQAQTLAKLRLAKAAGLKIIGAVNKIDLLRTAFQETFDLEKLDNLISEMAKLIGCPPTEIMKVSGKTGEGVDKLLAAVIEKIPSPYQHKSVYNQSESASRALIFDSFYDDHKGVVASVRVFNGEISQEDGIFLIASKTNSKIKEVGYLTPELKKTGKLRAGEIGYIATGIKSPAKVKIGDTIVLNPKTLALPGYQEPKPVVFVSFFPESADEFEKLKICFEKLKLNDSALQAEPDQNEVLGRGFKVGFLGRLHFEITAERLKREFAVSTVNTFPSVVYQIKTKQGLFEIIKPDNLPNDFLAIQEPMAAVEIIMPSRHLNDFFPLQNLFRLREISMENLQDNIKISAKMPLAELISDFDEQLKSATQGYASFSYDLAGYEKADVVKTEVVVAGKLVSGLSRFLPKATAVKEGRLMAEKLKELLPRQQFVQAIQVKADNRIIAREDIPALKKDVTGYLYGGDRTRKMKLWQKQQRGKKRLKQRGQVKISAKIFKELLKKF